MTNTKFKVDDKVKVKEDLKVGERYGITNFVGSMSKYKGQLVTIKSLFGGSSYHIEEDESDKVWADEMFERVGKPTKPKQITHILADHDFTKVHGTFSNEKDAKTFIKPLFTEDASLIIVEVKSIQDVMITKNLRFKKRTLGGSK